MQGGEAGCGKGIKRRLGRRLNSSICLLLGQPQSLTAMAPATPHAWMETHAAPPHSHSGLAFCACAHTSRGSRSTRPRSLLREG